MSFTGRRRCADALAFLEAVGLRAAVSEDRQRIITLTPAGKSYLGYGSPVLERLGIAHQAAAICAGAGHGESRNDER